MKPDELKARTTDVAFKLIDFVQSLPRIAFVKLSVTNFFALELQ